MFHAINVLVLFTMGQSCTMTNSPSNSFKFWATTSGESLWTSILLHSSCSKWQATEMRPTPCIHHHPSKHPRPFGRSNPECPKLGVPYQSMRWCASSQPAKGYNDPQWHMSPWWTSRFPWKCQGPLPCFLHRRNQIARILFCKCQLQHHSSTPSSENSERTSTTQVNLDLHDLWSAKWRAAPHRIWWWHPPRAWTFATSSVPLDVVVRHPGAEAVGGMLSCCHGPKDETCLSKHHDKTWCKQVRREKHNKTLQ